MAYVPVEKKIGICCGCHKQFSKLSNRDKYCSQACKSLFHEAELAKAWTERKPRRKAYTFAKKYNIGANS